MEEAIEHGPAHIDFIVVSSVVLFSLYSRESSYTRTYLGF